MYICVKLEDATASIKRQVNMTTFPLNGTAFCKLTQNILLLLPSNEQNLYVYHIAS